MVQVKEKDVLPSEELLLQWDESRFRAEELEATIRTLEGANVAAEVMAPFKAEIVTLTEWMDATMRAYPNYRFSGVGDLNRGRRQAVIQSIDWTEYVRPVLQAYQSGLEKANYSRSITVNDQNLGHGSIGFDFRDTPEGFILLPKTADVFFGVKVNKKTAAQKAAEKKAFQAKLEKAMLKAGLTQEQAQIVLNLKLADA